MPEYHEAIQRPIYTNPPCLVNANQVAHQLLVNGQGTMPTKPKRPVLPTVEGIPSLGASFSEEEYRKGIATLKYKAEVLYDVLVQQLNSLGHRARKWVLTMLC